MGEQFKLLSCFLEESFLFIKGSHLLFSVETGLVSILQIEFMTNTF